MNQPRNSRSFSELFQGFDSLLREYVWERPKAYYDEARAKFRNLPQTNFDLGCQFAGEGKWADAAFRFRFTLLLKPDFTQAQYNLGCCYLQLGKFPEARAAFTKALALKPDHADARFMLSGLAPGAVPAPSHMPTDMVTGFFSGIVEQYDQLAEQNGYQGARLVAEACKPHLRATSELHLIELGCGTGLVARPWRPLCREILGVDMTHAMVVASQTARAGDNPAFDRVLEADINRLEPGTFMPGASDVVLCIDTAQFLGDLAPMLKTAASALKPGGLLALTVEPFAAPGGYGVNPATSRFGHHADYVRAAAKAAGLDVKRDGVVPLYAQLNAHLFVFAKE
jgi:predicted TPR repeat methyltransferase